MREDLYKVVKTAVENTSSGTLNHESQKLMDKMLLDYERVGMALPKETRDKLEVISNNMSQLSTDFSRNSNAENGTILFSREELIGVPEDVIQGFPIDEATQKHIVTHKPTDYVPVMTYVREHCYIK